MPVVLAVIVVIGIVTLAGFLMWFMFKALGVDFQWLKEDAERLVPNRRKFMWAGVIALPVSVAVGAVIGVIVGPTLGFSVHGDLIGGAVGYALTIVLFALSGAIKRPEEQENDHQARKTTP
jgi:archaellum biogenesis protein FlaJ (TadC family)